MKRRIAAFTGAALLALLYLAFPPGAESQLQRNLTMTCITCHADDALGGFHGGFRPLVGLPQSDIELVCATCHDGVSATEAADHTNPGKEFGEWKAGCLDCHNHHYDLLAGDSSGNRNVNMLGALVPEASSTDGVARIRRPVIQLNTGSKPSRPHDNDVQTGWECDTGVADDPGCLDHGAGTPLPEDDHVRKLIFYLNTTTTGEHWAAPNTSLTPPYNGACNVCHTRTGHHRRDDSGGDHTHNISKNCTDCHNHKDGWVNRGG